MRHFKLQITARLFCSFSTTVKCLWKERNIIDNRFFVRQTKRFWSEMSSSCLGVRKILMKMGGYAKASSPYVIWGCPKWTPIIITPTTYYVLCAILQHHQHSALTHEDDYVKYWDCMQDELFCKGGPSFVVAKAKVQVLLRKTNVIGNHHFLLWKTKKTWLGLLLITTNRICSGRK